MYNSSHDIFLFFIPEKWKINWRMRYMYKMMMMMIIIREMYGRLRTMPRGWRAMEGRRPRTRPVGRAKTGDGGPRRAKAGQGGPRRAKAGDGRGGRRKKRRDVCRNQIAANRPCGWNFQLAASASSLIYFNLYLYTHTHTHTHIYIYIFFGYISLLFHWIWFFFCCCCCCDEGEWWQPCWHWPNFATLQQKKL